jgi:hypothetical protein
MELRLNRAEIEARVDELRAEHPGREEFLAAVRAFNDTLHPEARKILGKVLLDRQPETGGFDVITDRRERGGWLRRTMRKAEGRKR